MAVSTTTVVRDNDNFIFTVIATADADTGTGNVAHGMAGGALNAQAILTNLLQASAGASLWAMTTLDVTNVAVSKSAAVGSGNAAAQLRVHLKRTR